MRSKTCTFFSDDTTIGEAEHLVAAAVCEDWLCPADKPMESATPSDEIVSRPQVEMIGVAQQDFGAGRFEIAMRDAFDGAQCPDGHERGRLDVTVRRRQH